LLFFVSTGSPVAAQSPCYGNTPELTIRSTLAPADEGYQVSRPDPEFWIVNIGNSQNLRDVQCLEEPIGANSAARIAAEVLLKADDRALLMAEGVRLTQLQIHALSADGIDVFIRSYDWWMENAYDQADVTEMGHLRPEADLRSSRGEGLLRTHCDRCGAVDERRQMRKLGQLRLADKFSAQP
jgi:hypothetical protein